MQENQPGMSSGDAGSGTAQPSSFHLSSQEHQEGDRKGSTGPWWDPPSLPQTAAPPKILNTTESQQSNGVATIRQCSKPTPGATCHGEVLVTCGLPSLCVSQTLLWVRNWVPGIQSAFSMSLELEKPCKFAPQAGFRGTGI